MSFVFTPHPPPSSRRNKVFYTSQSKLANIKLFIEILLFKLFTIIIKLLLKYVSLNSSIILRVHILNFLEISKIRLQVYTYQELDNVCIELNWFVVDVLAKVEVGVQNIAAYSL